MTGLLESNESEHLDRKSLRKVTGQTADWPELARDRVGFANASGGKLVIGIEDDELHPPPEQRIDSSLLERIRKRIGELTVNVQVLPEPHRDENGGEYIVLTVLRSIGVASTSKGQFYLRVGDTCQPVVGDDVLRLANDRPATPWESMTTAAVPRSRVNAEKFSTLCEQLRVSDRVKASVKEKSNDELLDHCGLASGPVLTNLGILLVGTREDRARLGTAPVVQAIKYDERGVKVRKLQWDDYALSPIELIDAIWSGVPDFQESYELPDGMFRTRVPAFEERVIRELLVNALVHRPYTQRGDIFLNLHPDHLEVVNPGRLPLGVTPRNILHESRRRNDGLARVFHDLGLMEKEGSGFDLIYERLLATGRNAPEAKEGLDSVHVRIPRIVVQPGVIALLAQADASYHLTQRERITFGLLAQREGMSSSELASWLELDDPEALRVWIGRLVEWGLVSATGRTKARRYHVPPELLRAAGLDRRTTLARIEPYRLQELIVEDLKSYPDSSSSDIHRRVGPEVPLRTFRRALQVLVDERRVSGTGRTLWRRYRASIGQGTA